MQKTILIVEDCPEDRVTYSRFLNQNIFNHSYNIIESESGEEALIRCNLMQPDLILLDYHLPDFDGLEFIQYLQKQIAEPPPVIMLTGQGNEQVAVEALKKGIHDYLTKGKLTAESLNQAVNNAFRHHNLFQKLKEGKKQERLIAEIALHIRQSFSLQDILDITVKEAQDLLNCDRIVVYHFDTDLNGNVIAESVNNPRWKKSLGEKIIDTCFKTNPLIISQYKQGRIMVIDNTHTAPLSQCHRALLAKFQVQANLVVPIISSSSLSPLKDDYFWGLLIAHHCQTPYQWQKNEIELFSKLATQLAIAIQKLELIDNLKKAKQKLYNSNVHLEKRIAERTKKLSQAAKMAEVANQAKDAFISHMSHELRTPLNSILGFTSILKTGSQLTPQQLNQLDIIYQSGEHLLTLINDILDYSRLNQNKLKVVPQKINFLQFLENVAQIFQFHAHRKDLEFKLAIISSIPTYIKIDAIRVRQVLFNLLSNAIKFTETGSVTLTVGKVADFETIPTEISTSQLSQFSNRHLIRFQVEDTGIGIPRDKLEHIFTSFGQVDNGMKNQEGTGLGLTISQKILQLMNSKIYVESYLNCGSKLWFDLEVLATENNNLTNYTQSSLSPDLLTNNLDLNEQREKVSKESSNLPTFLVPPQETLVQLLDLAKFGDLCAIESEIDCLQSSDNNYVPFAETVKQLIISCQRSELESLIKGFIK